MKELLEWMGKEGFVMSKDSTYYSPKRFNGNKASMHYNIDKLIELFNIEVEINALNEMLEGLHTQRNKLI